MGRHILSLLIAVLSLTLLPSGYSWGEHRMPRSIELSAANSLITETKLPADVIPSSYSLHLHPVFENASFTGRANITILCTKLTNVITLHAHYDLIIEENNVQVIKSDDGRAVGIRRVDRVPKKTLLIIYVHDTLNVSSFYDIHLKFSGCIREDKEGIFMGKFTQTRNVANHDRIDVGIFIPEEKEFETHLYIGTYFRPHHARRLFPCFDEPSFKVPFTVSIVRLRSHHVLFNTELLRTEEFDPVNEIFVIDVFKQTPPLSTFALGFFISDMQEVHGQDIVKDHIDTKQNIRIWSRRDYQNDLINVKQRVKLVLLKLQEYWGLALPLEKLDIVALPGFSYVKPADIWGLILFKESELARGYYNLAQELVYQWLGLWITPHWWNDAHVNKAIAGFISVDTTFKIDGGNEFDGKYPMTILYSIYYEFSKRYPHSRITAMKQETTCSKTELIIRMLNFTLGEDTLRHGLQTFIQNKEYKTFYSDDVWDALTKQAHLDHRLCKTITINEIVNSWIAKDRIPMVKVERSYEDKTASVQQQLYLRERPHDVPEQDKMLWWIPITVVPQSSLNFYNITTVKWMKSEREVQITGIPGKDEFIIVNPEEIGPFPVNYDKHNWNLLANYLQTEEGRNTVPVYTRAKLLHDAWNLAYAGDLSFAIALNMTLFMKNERHHLVWNPVFTLIDHIGRHIDISAVHKKFEKYVRVMLTPLYEELVANQQDDEESWKVNLRSLSKNFLCKIGYKPCIEEAQQAYKKWMTSSEPDFGNPVANQYICPVFKWGTIEEWEFGLKRVINFQDSRLKSERTYLLKTLAGCPYQSSKIERLLDVIIFENNITFSDNDINLIFKMLSSSSSGYSTLFNILKNNWDAVKLRFVNRKSLWDNMINSATGLFTTKEGLDLVSQLYVQHQGEFGTAEHIIEKSLRNIKEETKWSDENLPVIEQWLDGFLTTNSVFNNKFIDW